MKSRAIKEHAHLIRQRVIDFRRHIHQHPEISFTEQHTAAYITQKLNEEGIECSPIAGTGVLARIEGGGNLKNAVVLRADIDALPVREETGLAFSSVNPGVMHACGHDMHTAALMGALIIINNFKDQLEGTLFGLFQPGEELLPGGASMVLAEDPFRGYDIRGFFGEHVEPELPTGVFGFRRGEYMASTDEIYLTITGEGGHAAFQSKLRNPIPAAAELITRLTEVTAGTENVLAIGRIIADGATNVIPAKIEMAGTMRTFDERWRAEAKKHVATIARQTGIKHNVEIVCDIRDGFPSVFNNVSATERAEALTREMFGKDAVISLPRRMTGEDFGYYTRKYPSLFYRFGVGGILQNARESGSDGHGDFKLPGTAGKLHTSRFNPDESALEYATAGLANLGLNFRGFE